MLKRLSQDELQMAAAPEQGFDIHELLSFAWRWWKFIAAMMAIGLLLGAIQLARQTPLYTASTQVLLDAKRSAPVGNSNDGSNAGEVDYNISRMENEIAVLRSNSLLKRVVEKERLVDDPEFGSAPAGLPNPANAEQADASASANLFAAINALRVAVTVTRTGLSAVLNISVTSTDSAKAARLANAVADAYAVDKLDSRFESAKIASAWLSDRINDIRGQLRQSEEAVANFKAQNGIVQTTANATLSQEQVAQLNNRLIAARAEASEKKTRLDLLKAIEAKGGSAQGLPDAMTSTTIGALRAQEADVSRREADLVARYGDRHPLVINVRAERRDVQRGIAAEVQRIAVNVRSEYELAKAREDAASKAFAQATGQSGTDDKTAIRLRELERTAAVNKTVYEEFLQKAKISEEQSTFEARDVRVILPAAAGLQTSPNVNRTLLISALLGLLMGVGGAFTIEKLNTGFTLPRQIEEQLGLPVLASISRVLDADLTVDGEQVKMPYLPAIKPLSRLAETIRGLRTGVQMSDVDNTPKVVMITSSEPGEGKSTTALMLAASAAASGLRVLIIDADLRHPSVSKFLGRQDQPGIVELLLGQCEPKDIIKADESGKFWNIPSGGRSQNPPDLLGSERMKSLMALLRNSFDYIVIDTPPMGPVLDGYLVSALSDKIIYVVKWAATSRETVEQCIKKLGGPGKLAGVVFNMVNDKRAKKYGNYAYSYYGRRGYDKYYVE